MCITAHYIDANRNLQKSIISITQVLNHKGYTVVFDKLIESCLLKWEIENILMVIMDNTSANDVDAGYKDKG